MKNSLICAVAGRGDKGAKAFTLLELILVMVLICTILAIASPSLRGFFASHQTQDAAAQIVSLMQYARGQAVAEGRNYRINFDAGAGTYWLTAQDGAVFSAITSDFGRTFTLPDGTVFDFTSDSAAGISDHIDFFPNNAASAQSFQLIGRQANPIRISSIAPTEPFQVTIVAATDQGSGS